MFISARREFLSNGNIGTSCRTYHIPHWVEPRVKVIYTQHETWKKIRIFNLSDRQTRGRSYQVVGIYIRRFLRSFSLWKSRVVHGVFQIWKYTSTLYIRFRLIFHILYCLLYSMPKSPGSNKSSRLNDITSTILAYVKLQKVQRFAGLEFTGAMFTCPTSAFEAMLNSRRLHICVMKEAQSVPSGFTRQ